MTSRTMMKRRLWLDFYICPSVCSRKKTGQGEQLLHKSYFSTDFDTELANLDAMGRRGRRNAKCYMPNETAQLLRELTLAMQYKRLKDYGFL